MAYVLLTVGGGGCVDLDDLRARVTCEPSEPGCGQVTLGSGAAGREAAGAGGTRASSGGSGAAGGGDTGATGMGGEGATGVGGEGGAAGSMSSACTPDACAGMPRRVCDPGSGKCVCDDRCEMVEATSCVQGQLSVCRTGPEGCLDWVPHLECPMGCADEYTCAGCTNECTEAGRGECSGTQVRLCAADARGCLAWQEPTSCADDTNCTIDRCDPSLGRCEHVPDDLPCAVVGNDCKRGTCDPIVGCQMHDVAGSCDDRQACTTQDTCMLGVCAGTLDAAIPGCVDLCPDDPNKTSAGVCGCGSIEDTADTDSDGTINCEDSCPNDQCATEGISCIDGRLIECQRDAQGCKTRIQNDCADRVCFDATHCATVTKRGWGTGDRLSPTSVTIDAQGNAYVVGAALSGIDGNTFGGGDLDAFLTKWSPTADRLWTVQWGDTDWEFASDVALNAAGDRVALTGRNGNALWVGVWSTSARAAPLWTIDLTGSVLVPSGIVFGPGGDIYVTGDHSGALPGTTNAGSSDSFLLRLSATNGATVWARQWGTADIDQGYDVATDGTNLYVAGYTGRTGPNNETTTGDAYVTKFTASGTQSWQRVWNFGQRDEARGVGVDSGGYVYVSGLSWGTTGGLLAKVSSQNVVQFANTSPDAEALAVDSNGNSYAAIASSVEASSPSGQRLWRTSVSNGITGGVAVRALPSGQLRVITSGAEESSAGSELDRGYFAVISAE